MSTKALGNEWENRFEFYKNLVETLRISGVKTATTGGVACVFYGYVVATKDCDIVVQTEQSQKIRETLNGLKFNGKDCRYNNAHGAPLDDRWLNHGWSSHILFGERDSGARIDIFSQPPRVSSWKYDNKHPQCVNKESLAKMKQTQRKGKDWDAIDLIGATLAIEEGDPRGLFHVFQSDTAERILAEGIQVTENMIAVRPALGLLQQNKPFEAQSIFSAEQNFWAALDRLRMQAYSAAWKNYGRIASSSIDYSSPFYQQHENLVKIAEAHLPFNPLPKEEYQKIAATCLQNICLATKIPLEMFGVDIRLTAQIPLHHIS